MRSVLVGMRMRCSDEEDTGRYAFVSLRDAFARPGVSMQSTYELFKDKDEAERRSRSAASASSGRPTSVSGSRSTQVLTLLALLVQEYKYWCRGFCTKAQILTQKLCAGPRGAAGWRQRRRHWQCRLRDRRYRHGERGRLLQLHYGALVVEFIYLPPWRQGGW
jgi:hypothetical protein